MKRIWSLTLTFLLSLTRTMLTVSVTCRRHSICWCWDMYWQLLVLCLKSCGTVTGQMGVDRQVHLSRADIPRHNWQACLNSICVYTSEFVKWRLQLESMHLFKLLNQIYRRNVWKWNPCSVSTSLKMWLYSCIYSVF